MLFRTFLWLGSALSISFLTVNLSDVVLDGVNRYWSRWEILHLWWLAIIGMTIPSFITIGVYLLLRQKGIRNSDVRMLVLRLSLCAITALLVAYYAKDIYREDHLFLIVFCISFVCCWLSITLPSVLVPALQQKGNSGGTTEDYRSFGRLLFWVSLGYLMLMLATIEYGRPAARRAVMTEYQNLMEEVGYEFDVGWSVYSGMLGYPDRRTRKQHLSFSTGLALVPALVIMDDRFLSCPYGRNRFVVFTAFGKRWVKPVWGVHVTMTCP